MRRVKAMSVFRDIIRARLALRASRLFMRPVGVVIERSGAATECACKIAESLKAMAGAMLFVLPGAASAATSVISFGVFPQLSTRAMVETYQPLTDYLSKSVGHPVSLVSAKDFYTFHSRTVAGEYALVLTAPHLAWLAWKEGGYRPVLVYKEPAKGFVVVRADSDLRQLSDLQGKTIAIPDPNAVVNIRLAKTLAKNGLNLGQQLRVAEVGSHTNAATYVSEMQTDAAVVGVFPFLQLPKGVKDSLRIIASTPDLPSHVFLVHPSTTALREQEIRLGIEKFMLDEAGAAFLKKTGFGGVRVLKKDELKQVEGDAQELKRRFGAQEDSAGTTK